MRDVIQNLIKDKKKKTFFFFGKTHETLKKKILKTHILKDVQMFFLSGFVSHVEGFDCYQYILFLFVL